MKTEIKIDGQTHSVTTWTIVWGCVHNPIGDVTYPSVTWISSISRDLNERSGFARSFWGRAAGGYALVPIDVAAGDYVEATMKDRDGAKSHSYYRVLSVDKKAIIVRESDAHEIAAR